MYLVALLIIYFQFRSLKENLFYFYYNLNMKLI